jgi:hypothetical protein
VAALEPLLWASHNGKSGVCFPSFESIAEAAGVRLLSIARGSQGAVELRRPSMSPSAQAGAEAMPALRRQRWRWRVLRTSNAYDFRDPHAPKFFQGQFSVWNREPSLF